MSVELFHDNSPRKYVARQFEIFEKLYNQCAPGEDSDQPGHPPSLIRVSAVRMKKAWVLSYPMSAQRRL